MRLNSAFTANFAMPTLCLAQVGEPTSDVHGVDFGNQRNLFLFIKIRREKPKRGLMPLNGFLATVTANLVLDIAFQRSRAVIV